MSTIKLIFVTFIVSLAGILPAQDGTVTVQAKDQIKQLLELKKELNLKQKLVKIQIYSGSRKEAENLMWKFKTDFPYISAKMVYETPSYKIWVGTYRTQIQADRDLKRIRKKYNRAFSFTPKETD